MRVEPTLTRNARRRALDGEPHKTHQLLAALEPRRKSCSMIHVERDYPFSWLRCFTSLVSYGLLLSDVVRTGPALRDIPNDMFILEPDYAASIGPVGYPVSHLSRGNATTQAFVGYWPYKYDTTSIGMRALAQHLHLQAWSPCLLYQERCDETQGLPLLTVFTMVDALVGAMNGSDSVNLRITSLFRDRLHHYAMPWFFEYTTKQSIQAARYDWHGERAVDTIICDPRKSTPHMCTQLWANRLKQSCARTEQECQNTRRISEQILQRSYMLSQSYPDKTIESVLVDTTDDFTHGGMILPGRRNVDVVLLSRVRSCVNGKCSTIAVDDYRFEAQTLMMNVRQWFNGVALLRVAGQAYTWLRVLLLVWICHVSRHNASHEYRKSSRVAQCRTVVRTIFLVPSQVVVYGSLLPISLYYVAHMIDSPATYALVSVKFDSLLGSMTWKPADIARHCAVSMRTVWVLSFYGHLVQAAWTRCAWSPAFGIPGISEYLITFVASLTLFAQYRVLALRNTSVLEVFEAAVNARAHQLRSYPQYGSQSVFSNVLFGSMLDWKCLLHAAMAVALLCVMVRMLNRVFPRIFPFQVSMISRTLVPHAADYLWPRNRLVVSWCGSLVTTTLRSSKIQGLRGLVASGSRLLLAPARQPRQSTLRGDTRRLGLQAHRELLTVRRSFETEAVIYLMNFAVMTDPITLLRLRFFSGRQVATYQSKATHQYFLLPYDVRQSSADFGIDWEDLCLVAVVNTKDLEWDDLLRCG